MIPTTSRQRARRVGAAVAAGSAALVVLVPGSGQATTVPPTTPTAATIPTPSASTPAAGGEFSLAAAVSQAQTAVSKDASLVMRFSGDADGEKISGTIHADFDAQSKRAKATVSLDGLPSLPGLTMSPGESTEDGTVPDFTVTNVTIPNFTIPNFTIPSFTIPNFTIPNFTIPNFTIPNLTIPNVTIPNLTIPDLTPPNGSTASPSGQPLSIDLVMDVAAGKIYVDTQALRSMMPADASGEMGTKRYLMLDLSKEPGLSEQIAKLLNPSAIAGQLADSPLASATDAGRTTVDGEEVEKYTLDIDVKKLMADNPTLTSDAGAIGEQIPSSVPAVLYVSRDNQLRGVDMVLDQSGTAMKVEVRMPAVTGDIAIDLPPADQVQELPGGVGGLMPGLSGLNEGEDSGTVPDVVEATVAAATPST